MSNTKVNTIGMTANELDLAQLDANRTPGKWGCRDLGHGMVVEKLNDDGSVDRSVPPIAWLGYAVGMPTEANAKLIAALPDIVDAYLRAAESAIAIMCRLDDLEGEMDLSAGGGGGLHAVDPRRGLMVVSASRAETVDI